MRKDLDSTTLRLLDSVQKQIPLVDHPFAEIGERVGLGEDDVLRRLAGLSAPPPEGIIRQISAIFDSGSLGYRSCLVAARIDDAHLDNAVEAINEHPGVSHNYRRNHAYNLWFTLAVPPDSTLGLERTIVILQQQSGAEAMRMLPSLKLYKIGVKFDLSGEADSSSRVEASGNAVVWERAPFVASEIDKRMIRALQKNLPLVPRPFDQLAREIEVKPDELLAAARHYLDRGIMRRFAAVLRHRQAGFGANAMGVWAVPEGKEDEFGATAATFDAVSHCYRRPTYPDWPYNVFTMVHGKSRDDCEAVLAQIERVSRVTERAALYSSHEYKKVRLKYFTPDILEWEGAAAATPKTENRAPEAPVGEPH